MVKYFSGAVSTTGCVARVTAARVCLGPLITVYQKLPETYLLRAHSVLHGTPYSHYRIYMWIMLQYTDGVLEQILLCARSINIALLLH